MESHNIRRIVIVVTASVFLLENIFLFLYLGKWRKEKEEGAKTLLETRSFFKNKESSRIEFVSLLDYLKLSGEFLENIPLSEVNLRTAKQIDLLSNVQSKMHENHILLFTDVLSKQIREYLVLKNLSFSVFELGKEHLTIYDNEFVPYLCVVNADYQIVNSIPVSKEIKQYAKYFYQSYENKYCDR